MTPAPEWYAADNDDEDRYVIKLTAAEADQVVEMLDRPAQIIPEVVALAERVKTQQESHPGADLSASDGRNPHEPTNEYIRRLVTERNEARAIVKRVEDLAEEFATDAPLSDWRADDVAKIVREALTGEPPKPPCHCGSRHA